MLYKALVSVAFLSCVYGFTVKQDDGSTTPYFVHPKDRPSGISPRIIGGEEVSPHSYPFQVALTVYTESPAYFCGGTLISNQLVLTAAHCVDMNPIYIVVVLGLHNLTIIENGTLILNATEYVVHEDWDKGTLQNDVALIRLPHNITFSEVVQPVRLAKGVDKYEGDNATTLGWGKTEDVALSMVLRGVNTTVLTNDDCASTNINYDLIIKPTHICTSSVGKLRICSGDSGGPLVVDGVQVGITSFGTTDCTISDPSVFTRVTEFYDWIVRNGNITSDSLF